MEHKSYEVLARKWRPRKFSDLVGQEHVLKALINACNQERLHHAYLFCGSRGVGKTTIARILAKCFNCEQGVSATPCGQCKTCKEIDAGCFLDFFEVDAASRTKVEDTRELLDNVQYLPTFGRFKVYLIDEVHMLSGHSFNALLKTLEEPPLHVKFLLATTDPQKLPVTVLSRCLQFNLKNLAPELITKHLEYILQQEQIKAENAALLALAKAADGSMRDALSLLDQAINYGDGAVTQQDVAVMLGTVEETHIVDLLTALATEQAERLLEISAHLAELGSNFSNALESLLSALHQITVAQSVPGCNIDANFKEFAQQFKPEDIQLFYQIGLIGRRDLSLAPTSRVGFEMVLLRMLTFKPAGQISLPQDIASDNAPATPTPKSQPVIASVSPDNWEQLLNSLQLTGIDLAFAQHCILSQQTETRWELLLDAKQAPLLSEKRQQRLQEALALYYNRPVKVVITVANQHIDTPARKLTQQKAAKQQQAVIDIENDANVKSLLENFNGRVDSSSIAHRHED